MTMCCVCHKGLRIVFPRSRGLLACWRLFSVCFQVNLMRVFESCKQSSSASSSPQRSFGPRRSCSAAVSDCRERDWRTTRQFRVAPPVTQKQLGSMDLLHSNLQASKKRTVVKRFVGRRPTFRKACVCPPGSRSGIVITVVETRFAVASKPRARINLISEFVLLECAQGITVSEKKCSCGVVTAWLAASLLFSRQGRNTESSSRKSIRTAPCATLGETH